MRHAPWLLMMLTSCLDPAAAPFAEPAPGALEEAPEPPPSSTPRRQPLYEGGLAGLWTWELPTGGEVRSTAAFSASFWAVLDEGEPGEGGVALAIPDGLDSCAATAWTADEAEVNGGRPREQEPLDAGALTLSTPSWSLSVPRSGDGYGIELNPEFPPDPESPVRLEASGGSFPGFVVEDLLRVPEPLSLLQPDPRQDFELAAPLELRWAGGSAETVWIELHTWGEQPAGNAHVACEARNDGAFTMPAEHLTGFPAGAELRLVLGQPRSGRFEVGNITVDTGTGAGAEASGWVP